MKDDETVESFDAFVDDNYHETNLRRLLETIAFADTLAPGIRERGVTVAIDVIASRIEALEADMAKLRASPLALHIGLWPGSGDAAEGNEAVAEPSGSGMTHTPQPAPEPDSTPEPGRKCKECDGAGYKWSSFGGPSSDNCPACHGTGAAPEAKVERACEVYRHDPTKEPEEYVCVAHHMRMQRESMPEFCPYGQIRAELAAKDARIANLDAAWTAQALELNAQVEQLHKQLDSQEAEWRRACRAERERADAAEAALERARALATEWAKFGYDAHSEKRKRGRELLAAIDGAETKKPPDQ